MSSEYKFESPRMAPRHHVPVMPALKSRKSTQSNIWIFESPKNDQRFIVEGDVAFMHLILLEGDLSVVSYDPTAVLACASNHAAQPRTSSHAVVYFTDEHREWWEFKRSNQKNPHKGSRAARQAEAMAYAAAAGIPYRVLTELDLRNKEVLFDNWLLLCAVMNRARHRPMFSEADILHHRLAAHSSITISSLLQEAGIDPALMLAVVAKSLQQGIVQTELDREFFGPNSMISRRTT